MNLRFPRLNKLWLLLITATLLIPVGIIFVGQWLQQPQAFSASTEAITDEGSGHDDDGQNEHGHAGHDEADSLELSEQALKNVGFKPIRVSLGSFVKTITIPAMVTERPGRSQIEVTATMTGIVTKVYPVEGQSIAPGSPLFEFRLTHEDLVTAQREFLRSAEELNVIEREIKRLQSIGDGVIPGKRILERQYEQQKTEAALHAQRQGLFLHGLTAEQVDSIRETRTLLRHITLVAPDGPNHTDDGGSEHLLSMQTLTVNVGQQVTAGNSLCVLADHSVLYIEGKAFEEDAEVLTHVTKGGRKVSALHLCNCEGPETIDGLEILYLSDKIEPQSRALRFYLLLANEVVSDQTNNGTRFIDWKFKPGQRMEVRVPIVELKDRIVLPVDAIVEEGAETFVFQQNGAHFDRIAVHVEDRDQDRVAIANDGALYPGDIVAAAGAYQMHIALKNKAGSGVDPHTGHDH